MTSEPARRSCSRSPAVARPWSGGTGQRDEATSGNAAAAATPAAIPIPVSNSVLMTTAHVPFRGELGDGRHGARAADAHRLDHERVDRVGRQQAADVADGRGGLVGGDRDADAAAELGHAVDVVRRQGLLDELDVEPGDRLQPLDRGREVPGAVDVEPQADLRPDRGADGPDPVDQHLGLALRAGLGLERQEPRFDRLQRGLGRRRAPERRDRRVDADAVVDRARRRRRGASVQVEPGALEGGVERPAGRPMESRGRRATADAHRPHPRRPRGRAPRGSSRPPRRRPARRTASPSPTRPSASTRRRIHASRSTHIPVAVGNGRRNGIRTRSATRPRMTVTADRRRSASPTANSRPKTSASRAVPLSTRLSWRGSRERPDGAQQGRRQRQGERAAGAPAARGRSAASATGTRNATSRSPAYSSRVRVDTEHHRERPLAGQPYRSGCRAGC